MKLNKLAITAIIIAFTASASVACDAGAAKTGKAGSAQKTATHKHSAAKKHHNAGLVADAYAPSEYPKPGYILKSDGWYHYNPAHTAN